MEKAEIASDEALDCVHEMDTINHYVGMYPIAETGMYATDGMFWEFLAYCAGTGGSVLIIGSAAGVAVMGILKIDFIWYVKNISLLALIGYVAGALTYILMQ